MPSGQHRSIQAVSLDPHAFIEPNVQTPFYIIEAQFSIVDVKEPRQKKLPHTGVASSKIWLENHNSHTSIKGLWSRNKLVQEF